MKKITLIWAMLLVSGLLKADTFSALFTTTPPNIENEFRNTAGVATDGMPWAIVIDTSGGSTGFGALAAGLDPFDINVKGQFVAPDLWYTFGNTAIAPTTVTAYDIYVGTVSSTFSIEFENFSTGDPFAIVWFPEMGAELGKSYGYLTDPGFIVPSPSANVDYSTLPVFQGEGDFRPNSHVVPEPSTYAFGLGVFVMLVGAVRRRGKKRA